MSAARGVLERLLRRAESARLRGADEHVSLAMSNTREYTDLRSLAELERFHAEVALAERDGAVAVQREARSGDGSRLLRVSVLDLPALARHLDVPLLSDRVAEAASHLAAWSERFPVIARALDVWHSGRKLRSCGPEAARDLADAAAAVAARADDTGHERILRRESVRLFGDSKRLEKLTTWLELLVTGELAASSLSKEEVWSAIGLRREPQPLLLSGHGHVELADARLPLVRPYLGLPVESVRSLAVTAGYVLTIENLASFHDATLSPGAAGGLLLYTGGMPSPAWREAYLRMLQSLPDRCEVYHWGDIDEGGFRIAAVLAEVVRKAGRVLRPWQMSPVELDTPILRAAEMPTASVLAAMRDWAGRAGWNALAEALAQQPIRLEQERLDPVMPAPQSSRG